MVAFGELQTSIHLLGCFTIHGFSFSPELIQEHRCWRITGVLWNQFATKSFGQNRLRETVDVRLRLLQSGLDLVREREQLFDPKHDFLLLGERGEWDR